MHSPAKSPKVLQDLLVTHLPHLRVRAARLYGTGCRADADDLVQDTIERALLQASTLVTHPQPRRWLLRVMFNLFIDRQRRRSQRGDRWLQDEEQLLSPPPYEPSAWELVSDAEVARAMAQLPPLPRGVMQLSIVEKRTYKEISSMLSIPMGTVGTRILRARRRLRGLLCPASSEPRPTAWAA
jgi:RNA polymerase sigma-70 factor (ECF subfamily)